MLGGIIVCFLTWILSYAIINRLKVRYPFVDSRLLKRLFLYHILLSLAYYGYVMFNPSDSRAYYEKVFNNFRGDTWFSFYGTSTTFIEFLGYPFIKFFGFSYEAMMALFSFFGFLGFLYFYIFYRERIRFKHTFLNIDFLTLTFFLPNPHFWSSSFGKGSVIFLGIGLFFFGINNLRQRILPVIIGSIIIYHVRPHVMLVILVSAIIGFIFSAHRINVAFRVLVLLAGIAAFAFIYRDVLELVNIDEEEFITQGLDLSHRATELSKATSGVDITNYNIFYKLFTFLYRPLFIDSPGLLGLFVSFENVFYLWISLKFLLNARSFKFLVSGDFLIKTAFLSFLTVSIALAQISGNLGLAMRQKSQVILLLTFIVLSFLDEIKMDQWRSRQRLKKRMEARPLSTQT